MDIHHLNLQQLADGYRAGQFSPRDAVDAYLERIARLDPSIGAYVSVFEEQARTRSDTLGTELRAGRIIGPLHGIPIAIKDLIDIEGTVTSAGSRVFSERRSPVTATIVRELEKAGAIILGKLHTVEFAFGGWGTNPYLGTPRNPWDMRNRRAPGGSSSGAGAAIAAGLAPCAIGTDTGGSVRLPASFCGISGLKTTKGLVSCDGIVAMAPNFDTPGPMARYVKDLGIMLPAICGKSVQEPATPIRNALGRLEYADYPQVASDVWQNYENSISTFEANGFTARKIRLPRRITDYVAQSIVLEAEAYAIHGALAEDESLPIGPHVRRRILKGRVPAADYLHTLWELPRLKNEFIEAMSEVDALLTPTTRTTAPLLDSIDESTTPAVMTRFVNLLGLCGLAVPNGFDVSGLPSSLQIVGRPFSEQTVLQIGSRYQSVSNWHKICPGDL